MRIHFTGIAGAGMAAAALKAPVINTAMTDSLSIGYLCLLFI